MGLFLFKKYAGEITHCSPPALLPIFFLTFLLSLPSAARADITTGLVGYWPLDTNTTSWTTDTTNDISGNGNTGTMVNMSTTTSPVPGEIGQALYFNGSDQ